MKKFIAVLLAVIIAFSLAVSCFAASFGDLTDDGKINSEDALVILMASTGLKTLTNAQKVYGDVNSDDTINASDALLVLKRAVGLIEIFPAEESEEPDIDHGFVG